jgi:hypothetical protein
MKNTLLCLLMISCGLFLPTVRGYAQQTITINTGAYNFSYAVGKQCSNCTQGAFKSGNSTFTSLPNNQYFINTGATIGDCDLAMNSYIYFSTDASGYVIPASVCPAVSATATQTSITFQTARVALMRGPAEKEYTGELYSTFNLQPNSQIIPLPADLSQTFNLIKGLTYGLYVGGAGYIYTTGTCCVDPGDPLQTTFYFTIDLNGNIIPQNTNAVTLQNSKKTMVLNTTTIKLDDSRYQSKNGQYQVCGYPAAQIGTGRSKPYQVVSSILSFVVWYDASSQKHIYYFQPY